MKKAFGIKLFAFALLAVVATACSKYEEGSKFTLLTKKSRIANTWKITALTADGNDILSLSTVSQIEATKDGKWNVTYTLGSLSTIDEGKWELSSDKTKLVVTDESGDVTESTIVRLAKDEMKLTRSDNGIVYNTTLQTK